MQPQNMFACPQQADPCLNLSPARKPRRSLESVLLVALMILSMVASATAASAAGNEDALLALLAQMEKSYGKLEDYTAVFRKHERVKGVLLPEEALFLKFKKPLSIYVKWIDGPTKEAIYVEGTNGNKVIAHSGSSLTWNLDPNGSILIAGNRHPITDIGVGFIIGVMRTNFPAAIKHSEIAITRMEDEQFEGRPSTVVEATFAPKDGRKYYATRMVCHIDKEYMLPIGISSYDEANVLMEEYSYKEIKRNIGLTDMDFARHNAGYDF